MEISCGDETFAFTKPTLDSPVQMIEPNPLMPGRAYCIVCRRPIGVFDYRLLVLHNGFDGFECPGGMRWDEY